MNTRLLRRVVEWDGNGRARSYTLRGEDLQQAQKT
jgi:hypothetical protein